jgi:peptidoglycan/LPS O-acetylase OafA/YrhL
MWRYRPELDGLRTFAVVIIVFFHAGVAGWKNSFIALDLFFVLSGFLVINVVLAEVDKTGRFRLGDYYARRVRRLLPAALLTIVVVAGLFLLVASPPERAALVRDAQASLLYLANWHFVHVEADYFAGDIWNSPFMHFWSLSVEEQYYIIFPLLILAALKFAPGRGRVLLAGLGVLAALSVGSQLYWAQIDPTRAYFGTDARLFQLLAGAMAAVALREYARKAADGGVVWPVVGPVLAATGLLGYFVMGSELVPMTVSQRNLVATVLASCLVLGLYTGSASLLSRAFSLPWMTWMGKISYGIYLWHWPAILLLQRIFDVRPLLIALMAGVLATALASLSYQLVETPIRRGRVLDPFPWRVVGAGLSVSVVVALVVVPPVLNSSRTPAMVNGNLTEAIAAQTLADGEEVRRSLDERVDRGMNWSRIERDRGLGSFSCTLDDVDECLVVDGDGPHVLLVGDSHARALTPAFAELAEEEGFRLSASVLPACPWQHDVYDRTTNEERQADCAAAREDLYPAKIAEMDVDLVVLSGLARGEWEDELTRADGAELEQPGELGSAARETVRRINAAGADAVVIQSIVGTDGWHREGWDPLDCLARADVQADCVVTMPARRPVIDSYHETLASENDRMAVVDLNPLVCPSAPLCLPLLDGQPVWRDPNHITAEIGVHLREDIWELITDTGLIDTP